MKLLLTACSLFLLCCAMSAQSYRVNKCVIEKGVLKMVVADYDPATGNSSISVNGVKKDFEQVYPSTAADYAINTAWFKNSSTININGQRYSKYGLPRILGTTEIKKTGEYKGIGVYTEAGATGTDVIYLPVNRGCEFQPFQKDNTGDNQTKIYYDEDWRVVTQQDYAAYYRIVTLGKDGKPIGLVKDYYITGEQQWQGNVSYMDPEDNNKDISEGLCTWFHKNGKKAAEVNKIHGKEQGVYKTWTEDGTLESEMTYKNGILHGSYRSWYPNGKPAVIYNYVNGSFHGLQTRYLSDGRLSYKENFIAGNPVNPCYIAVQENKSKEEICTEVFSQQKNVFRWQYTGSSKPVHDPKQGMQLKSSKNSFVVSFFNTTAVPKNIQSIYCEFVVAAEAEGAEYGLAWNYVDENNFEFLVMEKDGWWSKGSYSNGKRGRVEKMSRGEFWHFEPGATQTLSVARFGESFEYYLNGNPFYTTYGDFTKKGVGLICLGNTTVNFKKFEIVSVKE